MCSDENGAAHAANYLNAQLAVLYENARKCIEEHAQALTEENKHFYALAEFSVQKAGTTDVVFQATFDKPELKFICNHDVIFSFNVASSRLILDNLKSGRSGQDAKLPPNLQVSYRISFEERRIVGSDLKIGGHGSAIPLVIFDFKKASLVSIDPEVSVGRDLLVRHLAEYLEFLHDAGHHVMFSLPQFGVSRMRMAIDHSLAHTTDAHYIGDINGITLNQINAYLYSAWMKSAMVDRNDATNVEWELRALAGFSSTLSGQSAYGRFRMKLGPPRVDILCSKEVIVYFNIDEIEFFETDDFSRAPQFHYKDWKVAMVVNALYSSGSNGHVINIVLDLADNARYHHLGSKYDDDNEAAIELWPVLVDFFAEEYLRILERTQYHVIYSRDTRWEQMSKPGSHLEDVDGSWWSLEQGDKSGASSRATIQHTKMHGFDQVIAISQGSLNGQFATLCASADAPIFHKWSYEKFFTASFKPMSVRLLSNNRAIVWVHLESGHLKTLRDEKPWEGSAKYEFSDWRLAFEVELKMCSQEKLEQVSPEASKKSLAYQKHGNQLDRELRHIYFDLRNAEYLHDYSTFGSLASEVDHQTSVLKLKAIEYYLTERYFPAISKRALHVISSIPLWKPTSGKSVHSYALTKIAFHVYSTGDITRHNWAHVVPGLEPIIVVVGMTGSQQLPSKNLNFSTGWVVQSNKGFSHGTIGFSKRVFIEERLLTYLSGVNAATTLIPMTPVDSQEFHVLKTWEEHPQRKGRPSKWVLQPSDGEGCLKYLWEHCEEWQYKLRGNSDKMSSARGISCITRNYVELPTAVKQGALRIKIKGEVLLRLTHETTALYTATSSVRWSTNVTVQTTGTGIKVNTIGSHDPVVAHTEFPDGGSSEMFWSDPAAMLRKAFPAKVDLKDLVQEINAFEGPWQYYYPLVSAYSLASPVFNDDGDLLFELRRHGAPATRSGPRSPLGTPRGFQTPRRVTRTLTPTNFAVDSPGVHSAVSQAWSAPAASPDVFSQNASIPPTPAAANPVEVMLVTSGKPTSLAPTPAPNGNATLAETQVQNGKVTSAAAQVTNGKPTPAEATAPNAKANPVDNPATNGKVTPASNGKPTTETSASNGKPTPAQTPASNGTKAPTVLANVITGSV